MVFRSTILARLSLGLLLVLDVSTLRAETEVGASYLSPEDARDLTELSQRKRVHLLRATEKNDSDYALSLMAAAARERAVNADKLPGAQRKLGDVSPGEIWTSLGPSNMAPNPMISGRVSGIVTHPNDSNIVFVATAGGGVWRSLNAGQSWKAMTEQVGSLGTGAIALDPAHPNRVYLGLGDANRTGFLGGLGTAPGLGVIKSTDSGQTWSAPELLGDSSTIRRIIVSPGNSNLILVATDRGLFRSTNAGSSYQLQALSQFATTPEIWSIAWSGGNRFSLSSKDNFGAKLWYSNEQASAWTEAEPYPANLGRISIASAPSNPSIQYALTSDGNGIATKFLKSLDGGQSWSSLNNNNANYTNRNEPVKDLLGNQAFYNQMVIVNPANPNIAYFGGQLRLARTGNGGASFSVVNSTSNNDGNYVHPDFHAAAFDAQNRLYVGSDGGVYRSGNSGATWTALNDGLVSHLVYSVGSSVDNPSKLLAAVQDNGILHSTTLGASYDPMAGGDGLWALMSQANANKLIIKTNGGVFWSDDGGQGQTGGELTFNGIPNGSASFIDQSPADPSGETLSAVSGGKIYKSTDFGKHWSAVPLNGLANWARWVRAGHKPGVFAALAGNSPGDLYFTTNSGGVWTKAAAFNNADGSMLDMAIGPDQQYYAISAGYRDGKTRLWTSNDPQNGWFPGGWSGLPQGVRLNAIKADPVRTGVIYVGTDLGLYRSTNRGLTFSRVGSGLPLVSVADIWMAGNGSYLRVASYGRGVWQLNLPN